MPGIESEEHVEVILDRDAFTIEYDSELTTLDDMYTAILDLGYTPQLTSENEGNADSSVANGEVPQPIADALILAKAERRFVFVDFFAEWCIACKALDQETLSTAVVQSALDNYIVVKVDTDLFPESAVFYNVVGMPTLLILDSSGDERFRSIGPISTDSLSEELNKFNAR